MNLVLIARTASYKENTMVWILIVLAIAMVVGPVFMIQPSKRQRKTAKLRAHAASLGMMVKLASSDKPALTGAFYTLPIKSKKKTTSSWCLIEGNFAHDIHFFNKWDWQGKEQAAPGLADAIKTIIENFPDSISAFGINNMGIYVLWDEKCSEGDEKSAVENIQSLLRESASSLGFALH